MKRHWLGTAIIIITCGALPAHAGMITDTIAFSGASDNGSPTITGPDFDPALGTLTSVSVTLSGTYDPMIFTTVSNAPAQSLLDAGINLDGAAQPSQVLNSGSYTLTQKGNYLTGPAESFKFTQSTDSAQALLDYTGGPGSTSLGLASFDIFSNPAVAGAWGSQADDTSRFSGQFAITYAYSVPEPGTLALFAAFAGGALALRRYRGARATIRLS